MIALMRLLPLAIGVISTNLALGFGNGLDHWIRQHSGTSVPLSDIAYGNGVWVAVGGFFDAPPIILVSSNACRWDAVPVRVAPYRLIFTEGKFFGGGAAGTALISTNGRDWQESQTGFTSGILGIGRFRDMYLAMGQGSGVALSPDGLNWTVTRGDTLSWNINGIFASPELAVIMGSLLEVSTNAVDWTFAAGSPGNLLGYVRGSWFGQTGDEILRSDNLRDWTHVGNVNHGIVELNSFGEALLARTWDGILLTSHDGGTNWNRHMMPDGLVRIASSHDQLVTVGGNGIIYSAKLDAMRLRVFKRNADAAARVELTSVPGSSYTIEASPDLAIWLPIASVTNSAGLHEIVDSSISNTHRFYRAVSNATSANGATPEWSRPGD